MKRSEYMTAALIALFALLTAGPVVEALPSGPPVIPITTVLDVPLAGTVAVPLGDTTVDMVDLSGMVHVVSQVVLPNGPPVAPMVRIYVNLFGVHGMGDVTGMSYEATGAAHIISPSGPPVAPVTFQFALVPDGPPIIPPNPIIPLDITYEFVFSVDTGGLTDVMILSISVPVTRRQPRWEARGKGGCPPLPTAASAARRRRAGRRPKPPPALAHKAGAHAQ